MEKVILVGDDMLGKNKYLRDMGIHTPDIPIVGPEVYTHLSEGLMKKMWKMPSRVEFGSRRDGYFIGADYAIVFSQDPEPWISLIRDVCSNIPIQVERNYMSN